MSVHDDIQAAAYSYLAFDLPIIPLCSWNHRGCSERHIERCQSPGKAPVLKNWTAHKQTTEEELDEWFSINRYANIGLVLGQTASYNLVGVDIDGQLGEETFASVSENKEVPHTWEFTSGNGRRLLYQMPMNLVTKKNKIAWKTGHEELAFIANGQQTVLPPSKHPSGRLYTWIEGHSPEECDLAMAPKWILDIVKVEDEGPEDLPFEAAGKAPKPIQLSEPVVAEENMNEIGEGNRSNQLTRLVGSLCAKRVLSKEVILRTALEQNQLYCKPPLAKGEVEAMVETIYNKEMEKHKQILQRQRAKQELHPAALAEKFMTQKNNAGVFWKYNETKGKMYRTSNEKGPWVMLSQEAAISEIHSFLSEIDGALARTSLCHEIYSQLVIWSTQRFGDGRELNLGDNPYSDLICLRNGVLDWKSGELLPWSSQYQHTTVIEAEWLEYDPSSEAAMLWDKALHTWLDDEKAILFLQEYIGYSLLPSCKMRTATFLTGEGSNGKSLFLDAVQSLFASSSMVTQPYALSTRFGTSCIIDKLFVVCTDIDSTFLDKTGVLKQLIAGDRIRAEYKGGKEFDFVPVCKLLFSANKLPKSSDTTHGWYSRLQIVEFPHTFEPDAQYYENFIKIMTSSEGRAVLLHWAVEGLRRLTNVGRWTLGDTMEASKMKYRRDNDNVLSFMSEQIEASPFKEGSYKTSLVLKVVYATYREWCDEQGIKAVGQPEFTKRIQSMYLTKPLRWKVKGKWKSQVSIVDAQFREGDEETGLSFDGKASYDLQYSLESC